MKKQESPHPMVAVPDAIRIVLQETARMMLLRKEEDCIERVSCSNNLQNLRNRILAHDVHMSKPGYPPYPASIMDGYAVHSSSVASAAATAEASSSNTKKEDNADDEDSCCESMGGEESEKSMIRFRICQKVFAGDEPIAVAKQEEEKGEDTTTNDLLLPAAAYYVTTGAMVPTNCDCVIPIEVVELVNDGSTQQYVDIPKQQIVADKWIRKPGCDIASNELILESGRVLDSIALGLLLQSGGCSSTVAIRKQIQVGVLSTGNELITNFDDDNENWWQQTQKGKIPDVNKPILMSLLSEFHPNVNVIDLGNVRDDSIDDMVNVLQPAIQNCDVIITTGGISMGETDIVERVLVNRLQGQLQFGRLNMKPGKPTTFVTFPDSGTLVFAMPGNPVSAVVCTHLLVMPCLHMLLDGSHLDTRTEEEDQLLHRMVDSATAHIECSGKLAHDMKLDLERPEYHRVTIVEQTEEEQATTTTSSSVLLTVSSTGVQRSSRLMSLRDAQGLLALPRGTDDHKVAKAGEVYPVFLIGNNSHGRYPRTKVCHSKHLNPVQPQQKKKTKKKPPLRVGIVQIAPAAFMEMDDAQKKNDLSTRVEQAMSGSKSGSVSIVSSRVYSDPLDFFSISERDVDILLISCVAYPGSFPHQVRLATMLRQNNMLSKLADTLALQARRGAAAQCPRSALFEVVVGYAVDVKAIVVLLPEDGLDGGLSNIRGLLKHALTTARGEPHHHHHHRKK